MLKYEVLDNKYHNIKEILLVHFQISNRLLVKLKKENRIGEVIFRESDKVIQLSNMPDENVYNGDIGIIDRIVTSPKKEIHIDFDGNIVMTKD